MEAHFEVSVQTWKRMVSSAEYVFQVYLLNVRLGQILENKPHKYKTNYVDEIIKTALGALEDVLASDSIYLSKFSLEQDFLIRRRHLQDAKAKIRSVSTSSFVFLETVKKQSCSIQEYAEEFRNGNLKMSHQELEIGDMCETCERLISGVLRSDKELYDEHIRPVKHSRS